MLTHTHNAATTVRICIEKRCIENCVCSLALVVHSKAPQKKPVDSNNKNTLNNKLNQMVNRHQKLKRLLFALVSKCDSNIRHLWFTFYASIVYAVCSTLFVMRVCNVYSNNIRWLWFTYPHRTALLSVAAICRCSRSTWISLVMLLFDISIVAHANRLRTVRVNRFFFFGYLSMVYYVILSPVILLLLSYCSTALSTALTPMKWFFFVALLVSPDFSVFFRSLFHRQRGNAHRNQIGAKTAKFNTKRILWNFFGFFFGEVLAIDLLRNDIPLDGACVRVYGAFFWEYWWMTKFCAWQFK